MMLGIFLGVIVFALLMVLFVFVSSFVVWMTVDAAKQDKFWWLVLIVGIPFIGAVVYFFVEKEGEYAKIPEIHEEKKETQVMPEEQGKEVADTKE